MEGVVRKVVRGSGEGLQEEEGERGLRERVKEGGKRVERVRKEVRRSGERLQEGGGERGLSKGLWERDKEKGERMKGEGRRREPARWRES